jgi:uncharacterized protein (DUF1697 family)
MKLNSFVALLRGINVGGNSIVSMAKLKPCFEDMGFSDVKTFINSGNVIFKTQEKDPEKLARKIEKILKQEFGFEIKTLVKTKAQIEKICKALPENWVTDKTMRTDVMFLFPEADSKASLKEIPSNPTVETLTYIPGAIIWNLDRKNYTKSKVPKMIGTKIYMLMTARNSNTTRKLLELMSK